MAIENRVETPWLSERRRSFVFAFQGVRRLLREPSSKIHAVVTAGVVGLGIVTRITPVEWALVVLAAAAVWVAEALNTAVELLANAAVPDRHPLVGAAKDVAACGVLLAAASSVVIGAIVFLPRLIGLL
jgi:diacylglycerol kinase